MEAFTLAVVFLSGDGGTGAKTEVVYDFPSLTRKEAEQLQGKRALYKPGAVLGLGSVVGKDNVIGFRCRSADNTIRTRDGDEDKIDPPPDVVEATLIIRIRNQGILTEYILDGAAPRTATTFR
jgi:hypothetical protein